MKIPVFDCHADTPLLLMQTGEGLEENSAHISLRRAREFSGYAQFFAYCTYAPYEQGDPWSSEELYTLPKAYFDAQCERLRDRVLRCRRADDVSLAWQQGKLAAFCSLEGAEGIGCDAGRLDALVADGVRMTTLTWNADNVLAGCHKGSQGLSAAGREFVHRAQALGIVVDVSHCSDRTFAELMEITQAPVVASHSNSRSLCPQSRNLTDDMFCALCDTGGVAGVNLYSEFLRQGGATVDDVYAHIDHFLSLRGDDFVALGGDFDGCEALPAGFSGVDGYLMLGEYLLKRYPVRTVEKIFYQNILRVLRRCEL